MRHSEWFSNTVVYFKIYFKPGIPDFFLTIPVRYFSDWDSAAAASANLIFAGLYLHHAAEQVIRLDSLEKRAVKKKKCNWMFEFVHHWNSLVGYLLISSPTLTFLFSWERRRRRGLRSDEAPYSLLAFIKGSIKGRTLSTSVWSLVWQWSYRIWIPLRP